MVSGFFYTGSYPHAQISMCLIHSNIKNAKAKKFPRKGFECDSEKWRKERGGSAKNSEKRHQNTDLWIFFANQGFLMTKYTIAMHCFVRSDRSSLHNHMPLLVHSRPLFLPLRQSAYATVLVQSKSNKQANKKTNKLSNKQTNKQIWLGKYFESYFGFHMFLQLWQAMILNYTFCFQNLIHNPKSQSLRSWIWSRNP